MLIPTILQSTLTGGKRSWPRTYTVYADSLRAYSSGVNVFQNARRKNNNRIERANRTLRERVKVQRGWKTKETPLAEGNRIQYNFIKPHITLGGQTPAEAAGLEVKGWTELLKKAVTLFI